MRLFVRAAAVGLASALATGGALAQQSAPPAASALRIAYINSQVILAQAPGRAEAESRFQREMTTYQQQVQRMGDSLNTMIADYNRAAVTLSPAAKESREKAIRAREDQYQQRVRQLEQQAQQRQAEIVQPIMDQINKIINDIRAEGNYAMIFDAGSASGVLVAADRNLDITDQVLARLKTLPPATASDSGARQPAKPTGAPIAAPAGVSRPKTPPGQ
jgi:outer membrane protein